MKNHRQSQLTKWHISTTLPNDESIPILTFATSNNLFFYNIKPNLYFSVTENTDSFSWNVTHNAPTSWKATEQNTVTNYWFLLLKIRRLAKERVTYSPLPENDVPAFESFQRPSTTYTNYLHTSLQHYVSEISHVNMY